MKKTFTLFVFAFALVTILTSGTEDNNGKAGRTGSPGEQTCLNGCHSSFALNSGPGSAVLTSDIPAGEYTPGHVYNMTFTITQTGLSLFGLGIEALTPGNANAGTLTPGTGSQIKSTTVSGVSRKSITHTLNGGSGTSGSHTFNFMWTAPAIGTGNVTFYCSGIAANSNNQNSGDYVYNNSQVFTEFAIPSSVTHLTNAISSVNIFPNPVVTDFTLNYTLTQNAATELSIYSLNGELLQQNNLGTADEGLQTKQVHLEPNIGTGVYVLQLKAGAQTHTQKLIVQ